MLQLIRWEVWILALSGLKPHIFHATCSTFGCDGINLSNLTVSNTQKVLNRKTISDLTLVEASNSRDREKTHVSNGKCK